MVVGTTLFFTEELVCITCTKPPLDTWGRRNGGLRQASNRQKRNPCSQSAVETDADCLRCAGQCARMRERKKDQYKRPCYYQELVLFLKGTKPAYWFKPLA